MQAEPSSGSRGRLGAYIGFDMNVGQISSESGILAGAELALILPRRFSIGIAGYGLANRDARVPGAGASSDTLRFGYGGFRLGYVFTPGSRLRPAVDLLVGGGEVSAVGSLPREDHALVAEPSLLGEVSLSENVRAALGVSYRYVTGVDLVGISDVDLRGISGRLTLRVGRFK